MATVADLKEETPEKKIQAEKEVTDGEFQHPNVTSSDNISEMIDATVTDSNIIMKDTVAEETLHADHVKLPGEPKGEILCKTPELVQDYSEEAGQKETDLQETKIEMPKEKQACTLKDGVDKTYGLPVEAGQKDTSADVPVKIIIKSNHDIILASQDIEHVKIAASSISSRDCQETDAVTTVESIKEEVQRSNVIEEILPSEDNRLKNGSIIDSELEKEGNVSDSMVNLKTMVTTEQREYKSVVEEDSIVKTDDPSAIQHIERSQDDTNKKDERDAYAVETVDEVRKNQIAIPSTPETKDNQVATPSEIIEIKVPQNSEIASNFQASIEDDQQKDQYVNDINDTAVETGASGEQMLDESYATKDVKVKADAECSNMKESASADKSGSTEAVSDEHFETSITTISIEKDLTNRGTSYSEDKCPKAVESNQGKTAEGDELKSKEDFDILLVSESAAGEKFQVERTQDLAEVASTKEKEKPEAVAEISYIVIDEKEETDALPSTESTEEKTCQLNETSTLKNEDESSSSEPSVSSNIKKDEKEDDIHKEELVEDRNIHANLHRDDHEDEKLDRTLDTCETVGDDAGAMHPENTHGEIKNDQFKAVESETNDTNKDKAKAEEAEAAYTESENTPSQEVSSSSINDHHEAMIQDNNISIPGEDQNFNSHKLDEETVDVKDSQDQEISRGDCEKEYQNLNRKITESQHADAELVIQDSADKTCINSQETQLENLDKVPDTRSKIQSHEKTCISSVEDGETTFIPSVSGILKNDMQSDIVEETVILRNERESLNQETLAGERDTYSLPREDENEKGQTGASFYETFVEKENNSSEACKEEGTMKNTEDSVHGNQEIREKDLIEEEATYVRSDKLEDEINAGPSCTSKSFTETIDPEKEVKAIHASNEKILDETVATVVLTSKPLDGTLEEEKELETMHVGSEQLPDESVASSFINDESQKEITEGDKDHLIHSDQSSKTENILEEIEDGKHFKDDQISITEHLVKEVYPTNVEGECQHADIKSPGVDESAEELSNTQEVVPSSDLKLASETIESNQSSKDIAPIKPEDEENTCALQSESTVPSCDFSREQTYESNKSPVDMTLDPTGEIEIEEAELLNKECRATTTSDTDIEWKNQTESLTFELDTSSLEKKHDHEERKTDIELEGTCDDAHNVDGGPCAEEVHITNTEEIILDGDTGLESVKEVDECIHGDQDNKLKDLTEEEEATYTSGDKLENDVDTSPSFTSKPLTETIDPEKEVEAIHASSEKFLDKTVATVVLTSKPLDGTLEEEKEVETMHAGSEQLPDESVASLIINDESQKEIVEGDKDHMVHSDQSSKTDKALEDDRHFNDDQISVTENLIKEVHSTNIDGEIQEADIKSPCIDESSEESSNNTQEVVHSSDLTLLVKEAHSSEYLVKEVHPTNVEAESQETGIRSPGIEESTEELSNNTQEVVHSSDLKLASETTDSDQSFKDIAPIEAEDEEHTFALQSESTTPSSDFSREQTYQSNKAPVDMMLNKHCHATTTLDSDIETKDQTESLTCEVENSSFGKKDDHEEREIDIQLKGTCDDVQNVAGGPCAEDIHITKDIILDGDTGLESVKQVDVKCTHGDQDMVKDDLKEVEESDRGSIEKSMYKEAFMEDNAFHFSPEKHEEDQFISTHKAQDEAREKELADYSSKQENIVDEKVHDKEGVESENDPTSRTSIDNEEASRSITYGEKEGDTKKQIESLNPKPGDLPVVQTLFMKSLDLDDQKNDEGVEDPKTSRVEEVINIGDHSTVEDPKENLENKNVQEILHERDEKETVQTSLDFLVEKEGNNLLGVKVPIKGDMEQPTSMESREPAERVGTGTITKEEFTEFSAVEGMSEIKGRCPQAMEKDSLNEIDTTKMEGLKVQEFGIAREHSRIESEKVELRKENGNNGNGVGNDDNSKMQEEPEEGKPTDEKIDKKVDEKMQNQTERDAQSAGMLHTDIVEEYSVIDNLNSSEQNVNSVDSVKCKEETKDVEEQHKNMVAVPVFLLSATKETFEEKEKPEAAFCAATPSTEGEIIEKEKREAEVATTELFNTIPTTNNGTSNEKGQRMNVFEGEEKKNFDDSTIAKDIIFEEGGCDLKKSPFIDRNGTDNDKGDMVEIKMTYEQDLAPLVTAQSNSEVLDCNKLKTAEEKDEGTSKNLSSLSTTELIEGTICKDRGQEVPEDTSLVHNDEADPSKFMKEDESTVLMASQPIVTEGLLPAEEKVPTPKEEDACTVDNYLPVSQFLLNLIHEEFPDDENTKAVNQKQEGIVPKDYIKTETRTEEDNRDSMELPASNSSLMLEDKKHDFCERAEDGNAEGMEELKKLSNSTNEREIDKDTNDDNFFLSESAESRHGDLKILNDGAKEELAIVSESGIEEDMNSTHPSYDEKVYEQKTLEEHAIDKNIDVQEVDSKDEEILKQESNDSEDKIESQLDNEMINEAGLENKASVVIQPEEIKELEDSINNKGTLPNTQGVEQTKVSHSEIYVDDLQLRSTYTVEKIKEEVAEDQTTKMETLSPDEKEPYKNLDAVEQKIPSENIIIFVDPKEVQSNVETVDKAMEDQKAFSATKSAEVKCAESLVARDIEEVLPEVKTLPVTELAEATDPECIPTGKIVERDTDKKSTATTDEECLTTSEIVEKVKEEDETSTTIKSGVKDAEHFNGSEETAQSNQFQVAEVLGYVVVQGQKQGEIFENESEFVKETEKEEKEQMNINIKESSSGDLKESYLSIENQTDMQKRAAEDKNQNAESYLERKEIKDSTVKEEKIEEAKNESSGQNVTEESDHETAPLIEMKEGKHSPPNKKHGNILSGVRSKVKHSISSVKKAITCSSSVSHLIHEGN